MIANQRKVLGCRQNGWLSDNGAKLPQEVRENSMHCLTLSTSEAGPGTSVKKPLSVNLLLRRLHDQYEPEAQRRNVHLTFRLAESQLLVVGDTEALERVFMNLLYHALSFTSARGEVEIVAVPLAKYVMITVTDTGPRLKGEEISLLFNAPHAVDQESGKGESGAGLSLVKLLVEAHGGRITAHKAGGGSCFSVFLPVFVE